MQLSLSLTSWSAWAPDKTRREDWEAWAAGSAPLPTSAGSPDISAIPVIQRRRLSSLSRMAFATAAACSGAQAADVCCIFASRHGELTRTLGILNNICASEDVSPTDFSHSVHSTALGLFSIFMKNRAASTMVVAGEDTFGSALLETQIYLSRFPDKSALMLFFDEALPSPLAGPGQRGNNESFSIALLFSATAKPNIGIRSSFNTGESRDDCNAGLDFLRFYLSGAASGISSTSRTTWQWERL